MIGRRVVFSGPHQASWEEFSLPEHLAPHEALVQTTWSAVSTGTEGAIYAGTHIGFTIPTAVYPSYPHVPGYAAAGKVLAVGEAVQDFVPGDDVCLPGRHSSHNVWDTRAPTFVHLPSNLPPYLGAMSYLATISLNGIRIAPIALGDAVVVLGAGLIGQFAAQFARRAGGRPVVVADLINSRLEVARACGLQETVNPTKHDLVTFGQSKNHGRAFDVVIEATGAPKAVEQAFTLPAPFGTVVLLGSPRGRVNIDPYSNIHAPGVKVIGAHMRTTPSAATIHSRWTPHSNLEYVLDLLAANELVVEPLISHRLPAVGAADLYEPLVQQPEDYLGVVLDWTTFRP